jgi:hypothetical protein
MSTAPDPAIPPANPHERARLEADALRAVSRARAELVMRQPFFGALSLRLRIEAD